MPTYDYECKDCSHTFEIFQNMTDERLTNCPKCKKGKIQRVISGGAGIIFKGSGFYVNDSKKSEKSLCGKKVDNKTKTKECSKCEV
jgi:putative FmdB family regulatory protein